MADPTELLASVDDLSDGGQVPETTAPDDIAAALVHSDSTLFFPGEQKWSVTGLFGAYQVLLQTSIGSGIMMLPYCFTCGIGLALGLSLFFGLLSMASHYFLAMSAKVTGQYGYHELFAHCLHKKWTWVVNIVIFIVQGGVSIIYVHWMGRFIREIINSDIAILACDSFWIFLLATVVLFSLVLLRSLAALDVVSTVATIFVGVLIAHSCYSLGRGIRQNGFHGDQLMWANFSRWKVMITAASVNAVAYNCHTNDMGALKALRRPTMLRAMGVCGLTTATAFVVYNAFGVITYLDLREELTAHAAVECYPPERRTVFWTVATLGVNVFLGVSVPLVVWAARNGLLALKGMLAPEEVPRWIWTTIGGAMAWGAAMLASVGDNVIVMFDLVGGVFTPILVYLLPALYYVRCVRDGFFVMRGVAYFSIGLSVLVAALCGYQAFQEVIRTFG